MHSRGRSISRNSGRPKGYVYIIIIIYYVHIIYTCKSNNLTFYDRLERAHNNVNCNNIYYTYYNI